jgi:hypothetical protein
VSWGIQEAKMLLTENEIIDLPNEHYHRGKILRGALEGKSDYRE